jgi:hypothetical protein
LRAVQVDHPLGGEERPQPAGEHDNVLHLFKIQNAGDKVKPRPPENSKSSFPSI